MHPTLLVIDAQRAFDDPRWGTRNNPDAEHQIGQLLAAWRNAAAPVQHGRHCSSRPGGAFRPGTAAYGFKPEALPEPEEPILTKSVNSAFIGTDLEERLRASPSSGVVICGFTTDHCCSTTARMAANLGFRTWFVADATATFARADPLGGEFSAELVHRTALASLQDEFAQVVDTAEATNLLRRPLGADPR